MSPNPRSPFVKLSQKAINRFPHSFTVDALIIDKTVGYQTDIQLFAFRGWDFCAKSSERTSRALPLHHQIIPMDQFIRPAPAQHGLEFPGFAAL